VSGVVTHLSFEELEAGLDTIRSAPRDIGTLDMIVRRPSVGVREQLEHGELDVEFGLAGDTWHKRSSRQTADGSPHPDMQLNIMSSRVVALVAQDRARWALAGDQLFVDLDLSEANLSAGTRLAIGAAIVEVTDKPHLGCAKFVQRFGLDAMNFVNSPLGRELHLRGINARVVQPGSIRVGDAVRRIPASS
jgi:MOSC domain-containing protein YiiM